MEFVADEAFSQRLRKIKCKKAEDAAACEDCLAKNIACTFVFKKEMSGRTKRIQQAKHAFGTGVAVEDGFHTDKHVKVVESASSSTIQLLDLPRLFDTFKDHIWIIVPTTDVRLP